MKVKTAELTGTALDWAVAKCDGFIEHLAYRPAQFVHTHRLGYDNYSTDWSKGGQIVERECIKLAAYEASSEVPKNPAYWEAVICTRWATYRQTGPTALIAAMRCVVSSVLGDEIEVPDCLKD